MESKIQKRFDFFEESNHSLPPSPRLGGIFASSVLDAGTVKGIQEELEEALGGRESVSSRGTRGPLSTINDLII